MTSPVELEWVDTAVGKSVRFASGLKNGPKVLKRVDPHYPDSLRAAGVNGTVKMQIVIGESGEVIHAEVVSASVKELASSSIHAARQWVFQRTEIDGQPVKVLFEVTTSFKTSLSF